MPVDDPGDTQEEQRKIKKKQERMQVHATSGLQARYITRTDFDALVLSGLVNYGVLYGVDNSL